MNERLRNLARNKLVVGASLGSLIVGSGGTAAGLLLSESSSRKIVAPAFCTSPRYIQKNPDFYPGDPTADPNDQSTWTIGISIHTPITNLDERLIVGFAQPKIENWKDSLPVDTLESSYVALKIGPGAVRFSTKIEAPNGSPLCTETPKSVFSREGSFDLMRYLGASEPVWPAKSS